MPESQKTKAKEKLFRKQKRDLEAEDGAYAAKPSHKNMLFHFPSPSQPRGRRKTARLTLVFEKCLNGASVSKSAMRVHITARHLQLTPAIRAYVQEKLEKAEKFSSRIVWAQAVLSVEKRAHRAEIVLHAARQTFRALAQGPDLYAAIDLASDKIDIQLRKYKERLKDHHQSESREERAAAPAVLPARFSVLKPVPLKPMSREEAAEEMETLGYAFWMFLESESRQVQVVYRRQDDSYGVLRPVKWNGR